MIKNLLWGLEKWRRGPQIDRWALNLRASVWRIQQSRQVASLEGGLTAAAVENKPAILSDEQGGVELIG